MVMVACLYPARSVFRKTKSCLFLLLLFLAVEAARSQPALRLIIQPLENEAFLTQQKIAYAAVHNDSAALSAALKNIVSELHSRSYLEASFDSLVIRDSAAVAWLHLGEAYQWAYLKNGNVEPGYLAQGGFRQKLFQQKPFRYEEIARLRERLVEQAENNGYPFAAVRLDSVGIRGGAVSAMLFMEKGKPVFFDSLNVAGDVKISRAYLRNYLGIRPGGLYSRRKVLKIRDRLRDLPFLKEQKNAAVHFLGDKANVRLYLEKKRASRFDFLLGVLPDNQREGSRVLITGTFNGELQNPFGLGERMYVAFERLRPQTQRLELAFTYPYVLDLPFGVDLKFNQYKRDSTYTDIIGDFGVQYLFEGGNYLKFFWNTAASNLISVDTNALKQGRFPSQLDVKTSAFGLEGAWQRLDYRLNPRRGWKLLLKASAGLRKIRPNQAILSIVENFYDTLPGSSSRFQLEGGIERYFPLAQRSALKLAIRGGVLLSEKPLYINEQYRIGGNRLLRGFDEESVFATIFNVFTVEYRLLVGQNSYFYGFGDYGYVEDRRAGQTDRFGNPLGLGGGMTFETAAGIFGISVAVGKTSDTPLDFRNPKVHLGYVSVF